MVNDDLIKDMLWMAYRYCIGRHSYVGSYAKDFGEYFWDKLTIQEKLKNAKDIRRCIWDSLSYIIPIEYKDKIDVSKNKPLEAFFEYCNRAGTIKEDSYIDMQETYILDLVPWMDLASLFDVESHVMVTCIDEKHKKHKIRCYLSYTNATEQTSDGFWRAIPWKYQKIYRPVDKFVSTIFIEPTMIKDIEKI